MTPDRRPNKAFTLALWANAIMLGGILVVLLGRSGGTSLLPAAFAQQPPIAGGGGVYVMPGQVQSNVWGAYLLDIDNKTICVYQYFPGEKKLRLSAARSYKYDTRLENFNADNPSPREVKALVERQNAAAENAPGGGDK